MAKKKYDTEAAFKSIIGVTDEEDTAVQHDSQEQPPEIFNEGEKPLIVAKERVEIRSKRVNLVVKPSIYAAAQTKCKRLDISMNECINQFLEAWIKEK